MPEAESQHEIDKLIENLKSNLYYHGHPINRAEAKADLNLKVENAPIELEDLMWRLYEEYSGELQITDRFNPAHEWNIRRPLAAVAVVPPTAQDILGMIGQLGQAGLGIGTPGVSSQQLVDLAAAMVPHVSGAAQTAQNNKIRLEKIKGAYAEAADKAYVFLSDLTFERDKVNTSTGPQEVMKAETVWQRWEIEA